MNPQPIHMTRWSDQFILTPWTLGAGDDPCEQFQLTPEQALMRDSLYRQMVWSILVEHDYDMVCSLLSAGAKVFAMPGAFIVGHPSMEFTFVPEIANKLTLLPWKEAHETAH